MNRTIVIILAVIGALALICIGGGVIALIWIGSKVQPAEGINITITKPARVTAGTEFTIAIAIENTLDRERTLKDIDFWEPLFDGVSVKGVDMIYESFDPDLGIMTYTFNQPLPPLSTTTITFTLSADTPGTYTGDLDVSIDSIWSITTNVETIIIESANSIDTAN